MTVIVNDHGFAPQNTRRIATDLRSDFDPEEITSELLQRSCIRITLDSFADGRGFSVASLLRDRYNYRGEIRAVGGFIRDQLYLLNRCGFNAFKFAEDIDLSEAAKSLEDFTETYQVSADQENPLFRRR